MAADSSTRINRLLADWGQGNEDAREALIPVVYNELRRQARRHLRGERPDHTLESAALVNEAYLRLVRHEAPWQNRAHFFGVAAQLMRHILVESCAQPPRCQTRRRNPATRPRSGACSGSEAGN